MFSTRLLFACSTSFIVLFVVVLYMCILYHFRYSPFQQMRLYGYRYIACLLTVFVCCLIVKVLKKLSCVSTQFTSDGYKDKRLVLYLYEIIMYIIIIKCLNTYCLFTYLPYVKSTLLLLSSDLIDIELK